MVVRNVNLENNESLVENEIHYSQVFERSCRERAKETSSNLSGAILSQFADSNSWIIYALLESESLMVVLS